MSARSTELRRLVALEEGLLPKGKESTWIKNNQSRQRETLINKTFQNEE